MAVTKIDARPQPNPPKKKVAAYARVSTDNLDQKESLDAQKKHYETYIKAHLTWEFAGLYFDEGVSGTKSETRNGLQNMLHDCNAGKINYILTKSVSRFARNTVDCLQIARDLKDKGIFIYFEKERIDTGNMDSELMLSIFSSFAAEESVSISENEKWAVRKRFQDGTYRQSYMPYGYVKNEYGEMIPDKKEDIQDQNASNKRSEELRRQITQLGQIDTGNAEIVAETEKLLHFLESAEMQTEFKDYFVTDFIAKIIVYDRHSIGIQLKCELTLKEALL